MTIKHSPTPGFEFPKELGEAVDQKLRTVFSEKVPVVDSIRPERQRVVQTDPAAMPRNASGTPVVTPLSAKPHTVPNGNPVVTPISDPEAVSIDLPSKFAFYSFSDLYVKPFRVYHLAKVAKASANSSMQMMLEVVSSVLSTPTGDKNIAFQLTMADFAAVLYWLRFNSFTKKSMKIDFTCVDAGHRQRVASGELPQESLNVSASAVSTDVVTRTLDDAPDPDYFKVSLEGRAIRLKPETMQDVMEFLDHPKWQDEEFQYLAKLGALLDVPNTTLGQRVDITSTHMSTDDIALIQEFAKIADSYGVDEYVQLSCPECNASQKVRLTVDAPRFLSPEF